MNDLLDQCRWPTLPQSYVAALRNAVTHILSRFDPSGIIVSGSIVRGNPHPGSDFDIHVIHAQPQRQRIQKFFDGVPAEIFVNPPQSIRSYFESERKHGRPCTAHMLVTGFTILNRAAVVNELLAEAQEWLQKRPDLSARELTMARYFNADAFENALDIMDTDPANASALMHHAIHDMIFYRFLAANENVPRHKELINGLHKLDPTAGALVAEFFTATDLARKFELGRQIAITINSETGFFEWESELEDVSNSTR